MNKFRQLERLKSKDLNNTENAEMEIIFFNRVAKSGSETMMDLMDKLGKVNEFLVARNRPKKAQNLVLQEQKQEDLASIISSLEKPVVYVEHVNYINFTEFNLPRPIYINLVRDPVERVISWFNYVRGSWYNVLRHKRFPDLPMKEKDWYNKDFNSCVRNNDPECRYESFAVNDSFGDHRRQSLFFCGHSPDCLPFNSPTAIQKAKYIVEKEYAVVGSWEDTNITLAVLERYIPRFFQGATSLYYCTLCRLSPKVLRRYAQWLYFNDHHMQSLNARDLNNTRKAGVEIVFFNRVPKVGSQTFMELLRQLAARNVFEFHRDAVQRVETIRLGEDQQQELAEVIVDLPEPSVFIKHVCYTNFTKFNMPTPIYMNVVRDPIERVISWFYYVRAPWYFVERKAAFPELPLPDPSWLKKDFETCVRMGDKECTFTQGVTHEGIGDHRRQSLFFCGHDYECTPFNTVGALERAKYAVESQYAVVGVLEDLNTTLSVLEKYIPRFFTGASEIYFSSSERLNKINRNSFKPPVTEEIKDIVRRNFTREIEFYQFCKQRLHKQFLAVNLPQRILGSNP